MPLVITVAAATLFASFTCSLLEAALYSMSAAQVELRRKQGRAGKHLARMRENVEEPIAAILTVNTIAHTVGAAWCGAMVGDEYGSSAVGVFAAVFTVLVLALTEIVPKSLGVRYANAMGTLIVWPTQLMIWSVWPVVWVSKWAMGLLMGRAGDEGPTEDELLAVSTLALKGGGVRKEEHRWVANALRLDKRTAGDLRTPRTVVETLPADLPVATLVREPQRLAHSRVPITEGEDRDEVIGLVYRRELFDAALSQPDAGLVVRDLVRRLTFVPESMPAHELLDKFLAERVHMLALTDEYGGFEGVVSLEDVLECLLGAEIVDEHDEFTDMQALALQRSQERVADRD